MQIPVWTRFVAGEEAPQSSPMQLQDHAHTALLSPTQSTPLHGYLRRNLGLAVLIRSERKQAISASSALRSVFCRPYSRGMAHNRHRSITTLRCLRSGVGTLRR